MQPMKNRKPTNNEEKADTLRTESDVEQKVIMPLLSGEATLGIPIDRIRTKEYLAPSKLDKAAGKNMGYFPDYSVWCLSFPVMVVEAKAPGVRCEEGYREAGLYARSPEPELSNWY
jgi:type I site-specific restriction endonuclease